MSKFLSRKLCNLEAYVPGEQPKDRKYIKLNANESPYPPAPKVMEVINKSQVEGLKFYADPDAKILVDEIAKHYNVSPEQVFVGNGSDEVLGFCFLAFFDEERRACFPDITYGFYKVYSKSFNIDAIEVPLKKDFTIDVNDYVNCGRNIIIANPNAPTGLTLTHEQIELILKTNENRVVIIDEAYVDYGSESCVRLLDKYPNLIVVQTFSKSRNLAGARLGFALASKEIIHDLNKIKFSFSPYNINGLSLVAGVESVKDKEYFEECNKKIIATRNRISDEFRKLGFHVIPSKTNFIFVTHNLISGEEYYKTLREQGVLTRYYKQPKIDNYVRITIGTDEEMDQVVKITDEILSQILPICVGK